MSDQNTRPTPELLRRALRLAKIDQQDLLNHCNAYAMQSDDDATRKLRLLRAARVGERLEITKAALKGIETARDKCPICDEEFNLDDLCAEDIELGACHAACLDGSPVVDLQSGEPSDGPIDTFLYAALTAAERKS